MTREEKAVAISDICNKFKENTFIYLADSSSMTVAAINDFRRKCFEKDVEMKVVKNTLAIKAIEQLENKGQFEDLMPLFKGTTALLFSSVANAPAKLIKDFREKGERPLLKGAYIDTDVYVGDDQLKALADLKSKEDLLGEVVVLLQSPAKNVISALKGSGSKLAGLLQAIEERAASNA